MLNSCPVGSTCDSSILEEDTSKSRDRNNRRLLTSSNSTTTSDGTIFYLICGNFRSEIADTFYLLVQQKMNAYDSTALSRDLTFLSDVAIFLADNSGFPLITTGVYDSQISSFTPGINTFPVVTVVSGVRWLALTDINLENAGYVYGIADDTNQTAPNTVQIRNNLTSNNSGAGGFQMTYIASGTSGVLNITGLKNYTNYTIYYYSTSQDLGMFAVTSGVNFLNGTTALEPPTNTTFASIIQISIILLVLTMIITLI